MEYYLALTKHDKQKSDQLLEAKQMTSFECNVLDEVFDESNEKLRQLGLHAVPCVFSVDSGRLIHQSTSPYALATFVADSEAKLAELHQE